MLHYAKAVLEGSSSTHSNN